MYSHYISKESGTERHHPKCQRSGKINTGTNFCPQSLPQAINASPLMEVANSQEADLLQTLDYHRITECSGFEGTSVGDLVQPSCQSRVTYSRLHRTSHSDPSHSPPPPRESHPLCGLLLIPPWPGIPEGLPWY